MKNIEQTIEDNILTLKIDLSKTFGPSSSGKTIIIASSEGNKQIEDGIYLGINVYRKNKR